MEKYKTQDYKKHLKSDMKLTDSIFKNAFSKQVKNPNKLINVGYGYRVTRNILEDVNLLTEFQISLINYDLRYGLVSKPYAEKEIAILNQLKKSIDKTIVELFDKGDKKWLNLN